MAHDPKRPLPKQVGLPEPAPRRIETQIHRRKKAKAVPPLQAEWDAASGEAPQGLRMAQDKMGRRPEHA